MIAKVLAAKLSSFEEGISIVVLWISYWEKNISNRILEFTKHKSFKIHSTW